MEAMPNVSASASRSSDGQGIPFSCTPAHAGIFLLTVGQTLAVTGKAAMAAMAKALQAVS